MGTNLFLPHIREIGGAAPLLSEVGCFKANGGGDSVFDLGGNVAEWTVATDGSVKVRGGSADMPADQRNRARHPAPAYIGFLVVKEPVNAPSPK